VTIAGLLILPGPWREKTCRQFLPFIISLIGICVQHKTFWKIKRKPTWKIKRVGK
jgi:hypothetical protein